MQHAVGCEASLASKPLDAMPWDGDTLWHQPEWPHFENGQRHMQGSAAPEGLTIARWRRDPSRCRRKPPRQRGRRIRVVGTCARAMIGRRMNALVAVVSLYRRSLVVVRSHWWTRSSGRFESSCTARPFLPFP